MIVLDTDVVIHHLRGDPAIGERLRDAIDVGEPVATTTITVAEVLRGLRMEARERRATFSSLLDSVDLLSFQEAEARRFGRLMSLLDDQGNRIPVVDGLIAAITLESGARIWTLNRKHFARVPGLETVEH